MRNLEVNGKVAIKEIEKTFIPSVSSNKTDVATNVHLWNVEIRKN